MQYQNVNCIILVLHPGYVNITLSSHSQEIVKPGEVYTEHSEEGPLNI